MRAKASPKGTNYKLVRKPPQTGQIKRRSGFTLLEILMTMIIMTAALIPMMKLMPEGMRISRKIEQITQAGFLAQQKMEQVRLTILHSDFNFNATSANESATSFALPFDSYKYTVVDDLAEGIKNLTVTVWFDANNDSVIDTYAGAYQEDEPSVTLDTRIAYRL